MAGPELVRVISEFEATMVGKQQSADQRNHHEQTRSAQLLFARHVHAVSVMDDRGSPFEEESQDLFRLHLEDMDQQSVECLTTMIKGSRAVCDICGGTT